MSGDLISHAWSLLLSAHADGSLTTAQEHQLATLLRESPEFRREYVRSCELTVQLGWPSSDRSANPEWSPPAAVAATRAGPLRRRRPSWKLLASAVAISVATASWLAFRGATDDSIGAVRRVSGTVNVVPKDVGADPPTTPQRVAPEQRIRPGDLLKTDRFSSAVVELSDQSTLFLGPESSCKLDVDRGVAVSMLRGRLAARVSHQEPGESFSILTSQARVRVLGTELEVLAGENSSEIAVLEGRVSVERESDRSGIELDRLQFTRVAKDSELLALPIPAARDNWSEDFETGLPEGWFGRSTRESIEGKMAGVAAAIAINKPPGELRVVSSPESPDGLFTWHADSVLHVTYRVQPPEWFHIDVMARPYHSSAKPVTYSFIAPELWRESPGQWRTVSIPLSSFMPRAPVSQDTGLGRIPLQISFVGAGETGIQIDRLSVNREP